MLLHPATIGLLACEAISLSVLLGASILGVRIALGWDVASTSSQQLDREKMASLVSTAVGFAMALQVLSLFLFVETADRIHPMFTGAMCAAGTLNANAFGYPALLVKIAAALLCGTWLVVNHADAQSPDYPLLRIKFFLLPPTALTAMAGGVLFALYAARLDPEIITSCCSVLFDGEESTLSNQLPRLGSLWAKVVFFAFLAWTLCSGGMFLKTKREAVPYGACSLVMFFVSIVAVLSFISPSYYQLPTHRCPFCILQPEYHRAGYLLYTAIFIGGICGAGTGALALVARNRAAAGTAQLVQGRLCKLSMAAYAVVAAMATWPLVFSAFRLEGY